MPRGQDAGQRGGRQEHNTDVGEKDPPGLGLRLGEGNGFSQAEQPLQKPCHTEAREGGGGMGVRMEEAVNCEKQEMGQETVPLFTDTSRCGNQGPGIKAGSKLQWLDPAWGTPPSLDPRETKQRPVKIMTLQESNQLEILSHKKVIMSLERDKKGGKCVREQGVSTEGLQSMACHWSKGILWSPTRRPNDLTHGTGWAATPLCPGDPAIMRLPAATGRMLQGHANFMP